MARHHRQLPTGRWRSPAMSRMAQAHCDAPNLFVTPRNVSYHSQALSKKATKETNDEGHPASIPRDVVASVGHAIACDSIGEPTFRVRQTIAELRRICLRDVLLSHAGG